MANAFEVNSSTLKQKANELKNLNGKFKAQVEQLKTTESSLNSMWEGEANEAFHGEFNKDVQKMETFYKEVEKYATVLETIAEQYEKAEKANVATARARS